MAYYLLIFLFLKTDAGYYNKFDVPGQAQMYLHEAKYSSLYLTIQQFSLLNEMVQIDVLRPTEYIQMFLILYFLSFRCSSM